MTLTATPTSTIIEEFVQLLRRIHGAPQWTGIFNAFLAEKLATATDILSHPLLTAEVILVFYLIINEKFFETVLNSLYYFLQIENEEEITTIQYFSVATLLILGGLDDRLRLGGDAMESGLRSGMKKIIIVKSYVCNMFYKKRNEHFL